MKKPNDFKITKIQAKENSRLSFCLFFANFSLVLLIKVLLVKKRSLPVFENVKAEPFRNSRSQMFKIRVLKNFALGTGKHKC